MRMRHVSLSLAGAFLLTAGTVACEGRPTDGIDYANPSAPRELGPGTLLGVAGSLRLMRAENPGGRPSCEGAPAPNLRAPDGTGGLVDPAPGLALSAGGNTVLSRTVGNQTRVAVVTFCEGALSAIWTARVDGGRLVDVGRVPDLDSRPEGQTLVTGWSRDGARFIAVETTSGGLDGHRVVAIDATSGAVTPLGVNGYWADELAGGALVVDQGDKVLVGAATVPLAGIVPGRDARRLATSPAGDRVAIGTRTGLVVARPDGSAPRWTVEPVVGPPAWSPDGSALAYVTGARNALSGPLRVTRGGAAPVTAAPAAVALTPVAFAGDAAAVALAFSTPGDDAGDPEGRGVAEVAFAPVAGGGTTTAPPGTTPGSPLPSTPDAYAAAAFAGWTAADVPAVLRLTAPEVGTMLAVRRPRPTDGFQGPACQPILTMSYCLWGGTAGNLMMRVDTGVVAAGGEHGVVEAFIDPPSGGVAVWPFSTRAGADDAQDQADQGLAPWMLDPVNLIVSYATGDLGWRDVGVTTTGRGPNSFRATDRTTGAVIDLTVAQPVRTGAGGVWAVTRVASTAP